MEAYKLYVMNEEQSEQAQKKAFELGCKWTTGKEGIQYLEKPFLYVENKKLSFGIFLEGFKENEDKEISFHDFMQLKPKRKAFKVIGEVIGYVDTIGDNRTIIEYQGDTKLYPGTKIKIKEIID